jgi:hypothetical protein
MSDTNQEGGCLCGAIRYRVSGTALAKTLCHCHSCRHASGAPSLAWAIFGVADFALIRGEPKWYESSPRVSRAFCADCGTSLMYRSATSTDHIDIATATLDHADGFAPDREIWVAHKLSWTVLDEALPHYAESSRGKAPIQKSGRVSL